MGFEPTGLLHHRRFQVYAVMTTSAPHHYIDFKVNQPHIQSLVLSIEDCICYYPNWRSRKDSNLRTGLSPVVLLAGGRFKPDSPTTPLQDTFLINRHSTTELLPYIIGRGERIRTRCLRLGLHIII